MTGPTLTDDIEKPTFSKDYGVFATHSRTPSKRAYRVYVMDMIFGTVEHGTKCIIASAGSV
jgi:hypothetical protein